MIRAHGGPNTTYTLQVAKDQDVWARQLNTEAGVLLVNNSGGKLWVLGQKTEQGQSGAKPRTIIPTIIILKPSIHAGFASV